MIEEQIEFLLVGGYAVGIHGLPVPVISLEDLKAAKRAAGRHRDLDDLENLP